MVMDTDFSVEKRDDGDQPVGSGWHRSTLGASLAAPLAQGPIVI